MSTSYYIYETIPVTELFGGRLDKYGVRDAQAPNATADSNASPMARITTFGRTAILWLGSHDIFRMVGRSSFFNRLRPNSTSKSIRIMISLMRQRTVKRHPNLVTYPLRRSQPTRKLDERELTGQPNPGLSMRRGKNSAGSGERSAKPPAEKRDAQRSTRRRRERRRFRFRSVPWTIGNNLLHEEPAA
jgi:hypothetical protein